MSIKRNTADPMIQRLQHPGLVRSLTLSDRPGRLSDKSDYTIRRMLRNETHRRNQPTARSGKEHSRPQKHSHMMFPGRVSDYIPKITMGSIKGSEKLTPESSDIEPSMKKSTDSESEKVTSGKHEFIMDRPMSFEEYKQIIMNTDDMDGLINDMENSFANCESKRICKKRVRFSMA